jgi:hypothetical protein
MTNYDTWKSTEPNPPEPALTRCKSCGEVLYEDADEPCACERGETKFPAPARRVSPGGHMGSQLSKVTNKVELLPPRIAIHSEGGAGKTTLMASVPGVVAMPVEEGLGKLEVPHF